MIVADVFEILCNFFETINLCILTVVEKSTILSSGRRLAN